MSMKNFRVICRILILLPVMALLLCLPACKNKKAKSLAAPVQKEIWTCSMHPEIIRDKPGSCPICGMTLIKKESKAAAIRGVRLEELLQPADRFVISSIPITGHFGQRSQPRSGSIWYRKL